jgi:hypothetical protein
VALSVEIADAVVAEINGHAFSTALEAKRAFVPAYELSDLAQLRVTVVPKAIETTGASRALSQHDVQVDVGIQQKLGQDLDAEVAGLCDLVEEIATFLRRRPLASAPHAAWVSTVNDPIYAPEHLHEQRVFTSVLTLTYRALS